jgi:hypothetical protein
MFLLQYYCGNANCAAHNESTLILIQRSLPKNVLIYQAMRAEHRREVQTESHSDQKGEIIPLF